MILVLVNTGLTHLNLNGNMIDYSGAKSLSDAIKVNRVDSFVFEW